LQFLAKTHRSNPGHITLEVAGGSNYFLGFPDVKPGMDYSVEV